MECDVATASADLEEERKVAFRTEPEALLDREATDGDLRLRFLLSPFSRPRSRRVSFKDALGAERDRSRRWRSLCFEGSGDS
jgi:hypothetical protein